MSTTNTKPRRGRPPKIARDKQDTKAELIRSGLEQLTEYGFASSGIDQILKKVGVPKGSFYYYFASKEAFGRELINSYHQYFINKLDSYLLDETFPPLARLSNFVEDAKNGMSRHDFRRGCLVGNLGQEVDLLPETFRQQLIDIFLSWQERVASCLKLAQETNTLSPNADCDAIAEQFWIGWEGAVSRAKLIQSSSPLDKYLAYFLEQLPQ